jgi:aarF domain-containing kinase
VPLSPAKPPIDREAVPVPAGRLQRLWQFGLLTGELAGGALVETLRGALRGQAPGFLDALLSPANGLKLAERLAHLRGAAMKLGQLLSLEGKGLLPPEFVEVLEVLRAEGRPMPFSQLVEILGAEYGAGWEHRFRRFSFAPMAAASIGQVHRAETRDGHPVALKIQYPGVRRSIEADVDNVALILRVLRVLPAGIEIGPILEEAKRQLRQEADYRQEAQWLERCRALVAGDDRFEVPRVHPDLSTERILAMDYLQGIPIEALARPGFQPSARDRVAGHLLELLFRELFEFRVVQTDPNFANYYYKPESGRVVLLDFGSARTFEAELVAGYMALCRAVLAEDRDAIRAAAVRVGYLGAQDPPHWAEALVEVILLGSTPVLWRGRYDFGASDLVRRVRDAVSDLVFNRGFARAPPPETVFLHRKIVGTFLLCARLGGQVDLRRIVEAVLARLP